MSRIDRLNGRERERDGSECESDRVGLRDGGVREMECEYEMVRYRDRESGREMEWKREMEWGSKIERHEVGERERERWSGRKRWRVEERVRERWIWRERDRRKI